MLAGSDVSHEELTWNGPGSSNLTVHAARLPGEPPRGAVLVLHDTSELRKLERIRQEFVANVSHELKTPLSIIKACVETLIDGAVDDVQHRGAFLENVAVQTDRLHALILDLLSLAQDRVRRGGVRIPGGGDRTCCSRLSGTAPQSGRRPATGTSGRPAVAAGAARGPGHPRRQTSGGGRDGGHCGSTRG